MRDNSVLIAEIVKLLPNAPWAVLEFVYGYLKG